MSKLIRQSLDRIIHVGLTRDALPVFDLGMEQTYIPGEWWMVLTFASGAEERYSLAREQDKALARLDALDDPNASKAVQIIRENY